MCMLTYFPEGQQPDAERLLNGTVYNNDGHGFAIVDPDNLELIIRKGMDPELLVAEFVRMRAEFPNGPAMFHSRWGTGGTVSEYNCHPFNVHDRWSAHEQNLDDDGNWDFPAVIGQTVLGHNGILQVEQEKTDLRSDTRMACEEIIGEWYDLADERDRDALADWIGTGNKFVILTVDPRFDRHAYIINEKRGVWDEGVWYSNHDYIGYTKWDTGARFSGYGYGSLENGEYNPWADDQCAFCGTLGTGVDNGGFCTTCDSCVDCLEVRLDCQCYVPTSSQRAKSREEYVQWWADQEPEPVVGSRDDVIAAEAAAATDDARDAEWAEVGKVALNKGAAQDPVVTSPLTDDDYDRADALTQRLIGVGTDPTQADAWVFAALRGTSNVLDLDTVERVCELAEDREAERLAAMGKIVSKALVHVPAFVSARGN